MPPPPTLHLSPFFFFPETATTEIYTLSLHDALPICSNVACHISPETNMNRYEPAGHHLRPRLAPSENHPRSEEHTSELQSRVDLVCRLLLEKKKINVQ